MTVSKNHSGSFRQGQTGASYSITVSNAEGAPTAGAVTVTDALPAGLTATAIASTGWSCTLATLTCTRSDALAAFASYPAITLTVNVASNAAAIITNTATVSGGGEVNTANDTASDPTTITGPQTATLALTSYPNPSVFGQAVTLTATVSPAAATGKVTFYDGVTVLGIGTLSGGQATLTTGLLSSGSRSLKAYYGGDANFAASASAMVVQTVSAVPQNGFRPAVNYNAGSGPAFVAVGDFNGDGKADLAVANYNTNNVSVLLGKGDGTFQAGVNYNAGSNPYSVAVGDFNGDGKADLAVANNGSNNVSVLLGNGDGTFQAAVNYNAGSFPQSVAVGDFNGDGKADLAVANYSSNNVSVLLGLGNGTFQAAVNYNAGTGPDSVAAGDFNGDGKADLAVANGSSNNVSVLLGLGDGTFQAAVNYTAGTAPIFLAVGDFNADGKADLAVANYSSNNVSVLLGLGNGTFQGAVNYSAGSFPRSVAVGDFNGDGKADLAVAKAYAGSGNVSVLLGFGNGTFQAALNYNAGTNPVSVAVGDFNGDGGSDLAVANFYSDNVSILLRGAAAIGLSPGSLTFSATQGGPNPANQTVSVSNTGGSGSTLNWAASASLGTCPPVPEPGDTTFPPNVAVPNSTGPSCVSNPCCKFREFTVSIANLQLNGFSDYQFFMRCTDSFDGSFTAVDDTYTWLQPDIGYNATIPQGTTQQIHVTPGCPFDRTLPITLRNSSGAERIAGSITVTSCSCSLTSSAGWLSVSPSSGTNAGTLAVSVNTAGLSAGTYSGTITVSATGASNPPQTVTVTLTIFSPPSALSVSPIALNFGPQGVGTASAGQTVTVSNGGSSSVGLGIGSPGDFAQTNTCGGSLGANSSCTVTVTFTPTLAGPRSGSLSISDLTLNGIRLVHLFGTGISGSVGANVRLSSVELNFGVQATSTTSAAKNVTLTNNGDSTLTVTSVTATGDFAQTNNCGSVSAGGACTINVTFTPTTTGARTGRVTIVDNAAPGSPHVIRLFGAGDPGSVPAISFSSVSVNFGNQANGTTSGARTVTVTNTGTATLNITNVAVSGDFAASGCVTSLAPASACTVTITFTPTTLGNRRGSVTLTDNATGSPQVIRLFGNGT